MRLVSLRLAGSLSSFAMGVLLCASLLAAEPSADEIRFNRDVRPILSNNCFTCHGPDEGQRQTDLRLDLEASAFADLGDYRAVVPGDLAKSELIHRITTDDEDLQMPPADSTKQLSAAQIETLKKWVAAGAKWEPHWAQVSPTRGTVPPPTDTKQPLGEIDRFIQSRLNDAGVKPNAPADRRTLIRRLYFDLIGLPPSPAEVAAFEKDASPDAYEKLVERLLESEHFGERMAIWWLDLVRYADSIGYHSDNPRNVWLYRNWVIQSFNENKPFDEFTIEQLAGDLLPNASNEQKIASGYNRLLQTTQEGGAQPKEYKAKYAADRVRNVSEVWMGATMGCAECHDHKYDPYTAEDFYSMAAFFADVNEPPVGRRSETPIVTGEHVAKVKAANAKIAQAEADLKTASASVKDQQAGWEKEQQAKLLSNEPTDFNWIDDDRLPQGTKSGVWKYVTSDKSPVHSGTKSRKQSGAGNIQHFLIGAKDVLEIAAGDTLFAYVYLDPKNPPQEIMLQFNDGSWEHRAWWGADKIPYGSIGGKGPDHFPMGALPATGGWVRLEVDPAKVGLKPGSKINGFAFTQWDGTVYWDAAGVNRNGIGLPANVTAVIETPAADRTPEQVKTIADYYQANAPQLASARQKVAAAQKAKQDLVNQAPKTLITTTMKPSEMRLLPRGDWLNETGKIVQPGTPSFLPPLAVEDRRPTRLDLAHWLLRPDQPTVARAQVNRFWKLFFGFGIARTLNDLGGQGEWPTHPKLLDWLAVEFIESDWDVKHMVRLMVTSKTYRQASRPSAELVALDPYNRLFARQSRFRLDAEMVRDNLLKTTGLLVDNVGGPSVKPYQPAGYWQHLNFPKRSWQNGGGAELYRRGMYTWWQRTFLHPSLAAFDAPSREECTAERPRSNTPLQALVLLNDTTYVEGARVLAEQTQKETGDASEQMQLVFRQVLQRSPTADELNVLHAIYEKHLAEYKADAKSATALLSVGASPAPESNNTPQLAALTSVCRVVLNLHETMTRY